MSQPNINTSYYYRRPLVWLDTNAIIEMYLQKNNPSTLSQTGQQRADLLYSELKRLVDQEKIIVLESEQKEEYGQNSNAEQIDEILHSLTLGFRSQYRAWIHDVQLHNMIKHHHGDLPEFKLQGDDIFHEDPISAIEKSKKLGFVVIARMPMSGLYKNLLRDTRDNIHVEWEALRQKNAKAGISYNEHLEKEFLGHLNAIRNGYRDLLQKKLSGVEPSIDDLLNLGTVRKPLDLWYYVTGKKDDFQGMQEFMAGPYYRSIPYIDIHTTVVTKIITGAVAVDRGDYQDLGHASALLPYMSHMVVDSATRDRLYELSLPQKYGTKVYALDSYKKFIRDIKADAEMTRPNT